MSVRPRVAVVHFHLRRGGVTRVIETACRELRKLDVPVAVFTGEIPETETARTLPLKVCEGLGYDRRADCGAAAVSALRRRIEDGAGEMLGGPPDVWHFHNAALGRNPVVARLADALAREGVAVLSQCHDFAEDQRPANWRALAESLGGGDVRALDGCLYPVATHARIAVLNERDRGILENAGAPPGTVALLPNPVTPPAADVSGVESGGDGYRWWVYPTRAIRRKNLGEFVLWAAVAPERERFVVTLAPTQPEDVGAYESWRRLTAELRLPVDFGGGLDGEQAFRRLLRKASGLVTTSVAEGFGLAFLEPWLICRPDAGRRLPDIVADMEKTGIDLKGLYDRLDVPLEWIGRTALFERLTGAIERTFRLYGLLPPEDAAERAMNALTTSDGGVDFGGLDEHLQRLAVRRAGRSAEAAAALRESMRVPGKLMPAVVARNREIVARHYSPAAYGRRLSDLYAALLASRGDLAYVSSNAVLGQFLLPEKFRLLRAGG